MHKLLTAGLALLLVALAFWADREIRHRESAWIEPPASIQQEVDPKLIEIGSLGHAPSWVDAVLIKSFGDPAYTPVQRGTHPPLFYELKLITAIDPSFYGAYYYGALTLSVVRRDGVGAAEILERAHQRIEQGEFGQNAWFLEVLRGTNALLELMDIPQALSAFQQAAKLPGSPSFLRDLSNRLESPEGRFEVGLRSLRMIQQTALDEEAQARILKRLAQMEEARRLHQINDNFKAWLGKRVPGETLFDQFRTGGFGDLKWDADRRQVETRTPREVLPGFY